ncbi:Nn.00g032270.m01.CDS01, partial [Neocucurbitaria sp. VM-36]
MVTPFPYLHLLDCLFDRSQHTYPLSTLVPGQLQDSYYELLSLHPSCCSNTSVTPLYTQQPLLQHSCVVLKNGDFISDKSVQEGLSTGGKAVEKAELTLDEEAVLQSKQLPQREATIQSAYVDYSSNAAQAISAPFEAPLELPQEQMPDSLHQEESSSRAGQLSTRDSEEISTDDSAETETTDQINAIEEAWIEEIENQQWTHIAPTGYDDEVLSVPSLDYEDHLDTSFVEEDQSESPREDQGVALREFAQHVIRPTFCSQEIHESNLRQHKDEFHNRQLRHSPIWEIHTDSKVLPSVLSRDSMLTLSEVDELNISESELEMIFSGIEPRGGTKHICLHSSGGRPVELQFSIQWDLDSIVGFANSLAVFKHIIKFVLVSTNANSINSNLHFTHDVYIKSERTLEELGLEEDMEHPIEYMPIEVRKYHHRYFGRLSHVSEIDIYWVWPEYPIEAGRSPYLTTEEARIWTEEILLPAIRANDHQADNSARPERYDDAVRDSEAHKEGYVGPSSDYRPLDYRLNAEYLEEIWLDITNKVQEPGYGKFRGVQIFFSSKGIKGNAVGEDSRFYSFANCFRQWDAELRRALNYNFLQEDKWYLDFARQFTVESRGREKSHVLLWKKCCLEECIRNLYGQRRTQTSFYNHAFLRDACNATVEPLPSHPMYKFGLRYTQLYSSYKNIFDARKQWPFDVPYL